MKMFRNISRGLTALLVMAFTLLSLNSPAYAGMVGTQAVIDQQQSQQDRAQIMDLLSRQDLRDELMAYGVDPDMAKQRVAALSDAEVEALAGKLAEVPAGGDSFIGAVVFIFLVLLLTDILGFTDVFPFVNKPAR